MIEARDPYAPPELPFNGPMVVASLRRGFANLVNFRGRDSRGQFWPYALLVTALVSGLGVALMLPEFAASMQKIQRFAAEHPEEARVQTGPNGFQIQIEGVHPELMPDLGGLMRAVGVVLASAVLLLAASIARRLHDTGRSGLFGALPLPFIVISTTVGPKAITLTRLDFGLFAALFVSNLLYLASLALLLVWLNGAGQKGPNRYGGAVS